MFFLFLNASGTIPESKELQEPIDSDLFCEQSNSHPLTTLQNYCANNYPLIFFGDILATTGLLSLTIADYYYYPPLQNFNIGHIVWPSCFMGYVCMRLNSTTQRSTT